MLVKFICSSLCVHYSCSYPFLILVSALLCMQNCLRSHIPLRFSCPHANDFHSGSVHPPHKLQFPSPLWAGSAVWWLDELVSIASISSFLSLTIAVSVIDPTSLLSLISNLGVTLNPSITFWPLVSWAPNLDSIFFLFFFLLGCFLNYILFLGIHPDQINPSMSNSLQSFLNCKLPFSLLHKG